MSIGISETLSTAGTAIPEVKVESSSGAWSNVILVGLLGLCIGTGGIAHASSLPPCHISRDVTITICEEGGYNPSITELTTVPEQLAGIQRYMSLNVLELAQIFGVSRQTVHNWLKGEKEPHRHRQLKIDSVFQLAREWRSVSSKPLGSSLRKRVGESSVLDELARNPIDENAVHSKLAELHNALVSSESRKSIADVARARGRAKVTRMADWKDDEIL